MGYQSHKKYSPRQWQVQKSMAQQDEPWRGLALPFEARQLFEAT